MRRVLPLLIVAALTAACAPKPADKQLPPDWSTVPGAVRVGDTPTLKQVAKIYPDLATGTRVFIPWEPLPIGPDRRPCRDDWAASIAAETGRLAGYHDRDDRQYGKGFPFPSVGVYGFSTTAGAATAFADVRKRFARCAGTRTEEDIKDTQTALKLPSGLIGLRRTSLIGGAEPDVTDHRDLEIVFRKGNKLVQVWIQEFASDPDLDQALALVELARGAAGSAPVVKEKPAPGAQRIDRRTKPIHITKASDATRIPAEPAGLRAHIRQEFSQTGEDEPCRRDLALQVLRRDGFARGQLSQCDSSQRVLYVRHDGAWRSVRTDEPPPCAVLEKYRVPSSVGGDWCVLTSGGEGVDYPRD